MQDLRLMGECSVCHGFYVLKTARVGAAKLMHHGRHGQRCPGSNGYPIPAKQTHEETRGR
jgi:hypothetical protein